MGAFIILPIVVSIISSPVGTYPEIKEIGYYAQTRRAQKTIITIPPLLRRLV